VPRVKNSIRRTNDVGSKVTLHDPDERIMPIIRGLIAGGWIIRKAPDGGRFSRNRQLVRLNCKSRSLLVRFSVFSIIGSGRNKDEERRLQITTTYHSGLKRSANILDIVLGKEKKKGIYTGVDPRRLEHGGETANASTFVSQDCLNQGTSDSLLVTPYPADLFGGCEHQAYFYPHRFPEYCFNLDSVHSGLYDGSGLFSTASKPTGGPDKVEVSEDALGGRILELEFEGEVEPPVVKDENLVHAFEEGDYATVFKSVKTPEQFARIRRKAEENGRLGEAYVLRQERQRLRKASRKDLAKKVYWISQDSIGEGYDICSFETDGSKLFIEVKSTSGTSLKFEMTRNEWDVAATKRGTYCVYRVMRARDAPNHVVYRDPVGLAEAGHLSCRETGWLVTPV
jgi:hypothetical protein